jgi:hypothetical protein
MTPGLVAMAEDIELFDARVRRVEELVQDLAIWLADVLVQVVRTLLVGTPIIGPVGCRERCGVFLSSSAGRGNAAASPLVLTRRAIRLR